LTFLLPNNPRWRGAIKLRDELQWARTVPEDAPVAERREAAGLIWDTYVDWEIWIWDYQVPDLIQDATALGRHLRAGGLDELVQEIRRCIIEAESPQTRGNAVRVLSAAAIPDLDLRPDVREVLEKDEEQAVIRRKAAIAARDLGYHDLLDLIVCRAVDPDDDAEMQDCSIAAMDMATDDEVVDVALRLAEGGGGNYIASSRVERSVSSSRYLDFLSRYAAFDDDPLQSEKEEVVDVIGKIEKPTPEDVRAAAVLSLRWGIASEEMTSFLALDRRAALDGFREVFAEKDFERWWGPLPISFLTADELASIGAPERLVEMQRRAEDRRREEAAGIERPVEPPVQSEGPEIQKNPTLSELLTRPREQWDEIIAHHSQYYAREIPDLGEDEREDLRGRLREWWPSKPFAETITWKQRSSPGTSWSMENLPAAWIWFGPALDIDVTPQQWAELAASGVLFEEQMEWLQRKATEEGKRLLAEVCTSNTGREWQEALRATPDPLPRELIDALTSRLSHVESDYELSEIADRLANAGEQEALRSLLAVSDEFARIVRPHLAGSGDQGAIEVLLDELVEDLREGGRRSAGELPWLEGIGGQERFLEKLFECLVLAYPVDEPQESRSRRGSRRGRFGVQAFAGEIYDPVTPLMAAIRGIGGEAAVRGYDKILREHPGVAFMRLQRDAIAQAELAEEGVRAGREVLASAGLPYFPQD
jgi:hypothetical protein